MTSFLLKVIAIACMTCDHLGYIFFPEEIVFRIVGRLAFPIFAFCIAEGFRKTSSPGKYLVRLTAFALISEVPYDLLFSAGHQAVEFGAQNVFFTLALGLLAVIMYDRFTRERKLSAAVLAVLFACVAAVIIKSDYSLIGVLMVFVFYVCKNNRQVMLWITLLVAANVVSQYFSTDNHLWALVQLAEIAALPIIFTYKGEKGPNVKYLLYTFYPGHLIVLYIIAQHTILWF